jgi:drug/metabolite transporter (DMT)-like permease
MFGSMRVGLLLVTVIVAGVVYHLAQKTSSAASPWPMLAVGYGLAFVISLALASSEGWPSPGETLGGLLLGLAAFGIEAGFFFLYRTGSPIGSTSVIAGVSVTATLALIGVLVFGEDLSAMRASGVVLAVGAAALIVRG